MLEFSLQHRGNFVGTDENVGGGVLSGHYFIWLMPCVISCRYSTTRVGERRGDCAVCVISGGWRDVTNDIGQIK